MRGLTPNQRAVLHVIREGGDRVTIDDVADRTRLPRNRVVGYLRGLARDGYVAMSDQRLRALR